MFRKETLEDYGKEQKCCCMMVSDRYLSTDDVGRGLAYALFTAVAAGVVASLFSYPGTTKFKHSYCKLIFAVMVVVEFVYVAQVALLLPPGVEYVLTTCRSSTKGGKVIDSFRDCLQGQPRECTKEHPCSPCDFPDPLLSFDNTLWESSCVACTATNPGLCRRIDESASDQVWCKRIDGVVQPCVRCCLEIGITSNGTYLNHDYYSHDNCARVFDTKYFEWDNSGLVGCHDPAFPVPTAFGCCPTSALPPKSSEPILLGTGKEVPVCTTTGPFGASWSYCNLETRSITVNGTVIDLPNGCPLYSNGQFVQSYCRPPTEQKN